jgi:hypothetical protein
MDRDDSESCLMVALILSVLNIHTVCIKLLWVCVLAGKFIFFVDTCSKSLQDCKLILRQYLTRLELAGLVSPADGYQSIVSAIAKDICSKRRHRELQRKVTCYIYGNLVEMNARHSTSKNNVVYQRLLYSMYSGI